jgi:transposase
MKPLSLDLRKRIVAVYERGEGSQEKIAQRFGVGSTSVERLLKQWRKTGSLAPKKQGGSQPIVSAAGQSQVDQWLDQEPSLTQAELAQRFNTESGRSVSPRTMGRLRARLGYTRKKRR